MYSPFKLTEFSNDFFEISENIDLAKRLTDFFNDEKNNYLWNIHLSRQRMAPELKHTRSINLRIPKPQKAISTTREYNEVLDIEDFDLRYKIPLFTETASWIESSLKNTGAKNVVMGRIFFSLLLPNQKVGTHIDAGAYFDYFDRFHLIVQAEDNKFGIRDNEFVFEQGKFYWFNNHVPHSLTNNSDKGRIILIVDARLE